MAGHRDVASQHENVDAGRIQLANELGTAIGVHLEVEVRHDLELHDSMTRSAVGLPCVANSPAQFRERGHPVHQVAPVRLVDGVNEALFLLGRKRRRHQIDDALEDVHALLRR